MTTYQWDDLAQLIGELVDEAINSTMSMLNYAGSVEKGFQGNDIFISPLGAHYEGSSLVQGGQITNQMTGYADTFRMLPGWPFEDLQGLVSYYETTIPPLFEPWWGTPRPEDLQTQVDQSHKAAHTLAYTGGNTDVGPGVAYFGPNEDLRGIQQIQQRVSNLDGDAILAFERNFSDRLDDVVDAQDAAACMAWVGVAGEQNIWVKARESLAEVAGQGVEAMKHARGGGGGGFGALLNVLGAVALIAAEFATEGAVTPLVIAGVGAQTASDFVPEKSEGETVPLGASNPLDVITNIHDALEKLKAHIKQEESWISTRLSGIADAMFGGQRGQFDLGQPALAHETRKSELYRAGEMKYSYDTMAAVAKQDIPTVSGAIRSASGLFLDTGSGPWTRPDDIGSGSTGPYSDWSSLNIALKSVTLETAQSLDTAAEALTILAQDFGKGDAIVRRDMGALAAKLDARAADAWRDAR